jgi:hypothetical protein
MKKTARDAINWFNIEFMYSEFFGETMNDQSVVKKRGRPRGRVASQSTTLRITPELRAQLESYLQAEKARGVNLTLGLIAQAALADYLAKRERELAELHGKAVEQKELVLL